MLVYSYFLICCLFLLSYFYKVPIRYFMCNPTTGSPTITLFQLRSNYYTVFNPHKLTSTTSSLQKLVLFKVKIHLSQSGKTGIFRNLNITETNMEIVNRYFN